VGEVLRVSLGAGDVDSRPYYAADPDDWIAKALVASEDGTFWTHCGVRPLSVLRAACQNLFYRRRVSGASTITMQVVRLIRPHPKTLWWKFKEAVYALKMECAKDKRWILSQYLNRAPYGSNFIGIEAAAHGWFGKGAKDLGLAEAALLAGMAQAPSRFRPDRNYERALKRRDYVLGRMLALGMITEAQKAAAQGSASAQASLGLCCLRGWGCSRDQQAAVRWYSMAASQGNVTAMNDLAFCFLHGCGVEKNAEIGFNWALRAAERDFAPAQTMVGECYLDGRGVKADAKAGEAWLFRAAQQGNKRARTLLESR